MTTIPKSYKKNIAEGNGILIFAVFFAIVVRIVYFLNFETIAPESTDGYLWAPLASLFDNKAISFVCSGILAASLAVFSAHINTKHVLIRRKTILPAAMTILLFSCHPTFLYMSAEYISALFYLLIISILFAAFSNNSKQIAAFKASFILTLASFFTPVILIYFPLLWIALIMMRCMNFKAFLASLLGFSILYFPAFSFYLFTDNMDTFLKPFMVFNLQQLPQMLFFNLSFINWIILGLSSILLGIIITDNYVNRHKDKIKTRVYLRVLSTIAVTAIPVYLLFNINPIFNIFIALCSGSLLLSHFFALAERKATVILFYISAVTYILICFSPFLSL